MALQIFRSNGKGNIDVPFAPMTPFEFLWLRVHFTDKSVAGDALTTTATVQMQMDSQFGEAYDTIIEDWEKRGIGADVSYRVSEDEKAGAFWSFLARDELKVTWTSPDVGKILWGIEMGMDIG